MNLAQRLGLYFSFLGILAKSKEDLKESSGSKQAVLTEELAA